VKILLAVDGSEPSESAARELQARPWPAGTRVRVLHVLPPPMFGTTGSTSSTATMGPTSPDAGLDTERALAERATAKSRAIAEQLKAAGIDTEFKQREGDVSPSIVDEAKEWAADLIVMGSHGYTGLKRLLIGSVAQAVVSHAPCSVEVVRKPATQR
jgi:nucleotide-binding universal stress UspA family protein